jgi:hypothetical protein
MHRQNHDGAQQDKQNVGRGFQWFHAGSPFINALKIKAKMKLPSKSHSRLSIFIYQSVMKVNLKLCAKTVLIKIDKHYFGENRRWQYGANGLLVKIGSLWCIVRNIAFGHKHPQTPCLPHFSRHVARLWAATPVKIPAHSPANGPARILCQH